MTKNVMITGASSGIGAALAKELAARGYNVALTARRVDRLQSLSETITQTYGVNAPVFTLDVADNEAVRSVLNNARDQLGSLDIVIANAGITAVHRTGKTDFSNEEQVIQTNVIGAMSTVNAAAAIFREQGYGHIVGMSSVSAFAPIVGSGAYSASKAALTSYLQAARRELASKKITVTTIHPGFINTEIAENMDKYPFVISAEKAAKEMANAIEAKKGDVMVPRWPWGAIVPLLKTLPDFITKRAF